MSEKACWERTKPITPAFNWSEISKGNLLAPTRNTSPAPDPIQTTKKGHLQNKRNAEEFCDQRKT